MAIFSKPADKREDVYKDIKYVAKGVLLNKLDFPDSLKKLVSLENYADKK